MKKKNGSIKTIAYKHVCPSVTGRSDFYVTQYNNNNK